ncbi:BcCHSIII, class III chitin synthase [Lophiotrema nucula]|uniref:Chitin synthase n=1 Tax=Lophiotrema nucula TaxID=690887 RepID=A0A6A5YJ92_9PLEO|nr:BcCHSIII, class III chitin synthase [Lophiotrema nucula]
MHRSTPAEATTPWANQWIGPYPDDRFDTFQAEYWRQRPRPSSTYSPLDLDQANGVERQRQDPLGRLKRSSTRKVKLVDGEVLSADYPVPSAVRNATEPRYRELSGTNEFTHMRYTAATCDPNDFTLAKGYNLRPVLYNRHTELLISISYYCEDKSMLAKTLTSVMLETRRIFDQKKSEFWNKGGPACQKIVTCIVCDGIDPCDQGALDVLETIGLYQDGVMKKDVDGKEVQAHIFEYTTQIAVTEDQRLVQNTVNSNLIPPTQLILTLKSRNSQKINSHRWLFTGIGRLLNPEVCVTIDAGTKVKPYGIHRLWIAFYNDKDLGACCGVIEPELGRWCRGLLNPLVAAQYFEYKVSYILDKAMESAFGYLNVLPGAFSAYRFRAIMGRPLEQYFHGDPTLIKMLGKKGVEGMNAFKRNMFLAEDRILAYELITKAGTKWHTLVITEARAETDVPDNMIDFITQRRRWLNGALASTVYNLSHFSRIYKSNHNILRMGFLHVQVAYNVLSFILSWFNLATFFLTIFVVTDLASSPNDGSNVRPFPFGKATPVFNAVLQTMYMVVVCWQFILALGNRPIGQTLSYLVSFIFFAIVQLYFIINVIYFMYCVIRDKTATSNGNSYSYISTFYTDIGQLTVWVTCASVFGVYYVAAFLHFDPWFMFTAYPQYLFVLSSYTNIINIYAFSNAHDVSWGSKTTHTALEALPSVVTTNVRREGRRDTVEIVEELPSFRTDIDSHFEKVVKRALTPYKRPSRSSTMTIEDKFRQYRTMLIAVYAFTNFLLCLIVMNDSFDKLKFLGNSRTHKIWFFKIWMWATSVCFGMRFVGSTWTRGHTLLVLCFFRK